MRPSSNLRAPLALIVAAALTACASKKAGTPDNEPTLKVLAGRSVEVGPDAGIKATPEQTIAAYTKFLEIAPKAAQRPEAMRRLGDLVQRVRLFQYHYNLSSPPGFFAHGDERI